MMVLAIESSCDETAAAVLADGRVLSDVIASQDELHSSYGGVVPELAARAHMETVAPVVEETLARAGVLVEDIEGIAVTSGPGLVICLLVGMSAAKGIAFGLGLPLVGVNHLDGHLSAIMVDESQAPPSFPHAGLVVSGGHTALYLVKSPGEYELLGSTIDDAAGEAFDKAARLLGLPYPGGPEIEKLSREGDETAVDLPRPMLDKPGYDFSFSGLKTAVKNHWNKSKGGERERADLAASFQAAAVQVLVKKSMAAARNCKVHELVVSGGVAANGRLRRAFLAEGGSTGIEVKFPALRLCTDNAAMIAAAGHRELVKGVDNGTDLSPRPVWPLGVRAEKDRRA